MTANVATFLVPLAVLIVGVLAYALASNGKIQELGRIAYAVGLFWFVAVLARDVLRL